MQILPGQLLWFPLILFPVEAPITKKQRIISERAFLDPIDYTLGKKSCDDGYVHGVDNFIVTGFLNVTGLNPPRINATFNVLYFYIFYLAWALPTPFNLMEEACTDIEHVPLDKCGCKYESSVIIRVKCNITADIEQTNAPFVLRIVPDRYKWSAHKNMTKVYADASCKMGASTNGGMSSYGGHNRKPGHIILVTALVSTVTSMVFSGQ